MHLSWKDKNKRLQDDEQCGGVTCRAGVLCGGVTCRAGCLECQQEVQLSSASERKTAEQIAEEGLGTWLSQ